MISKTKNVSIILPTHNEGKSIFHTLSEIEESLLKIEGYNSKIFIAEDGSRDDTRQEVERFATKASIETVLTTSSERLGYSRGVQRAIRESTEEILVFLDSDGQYNPEQIRILLNNLEENSIVCGVRTPRNDSYLRKFYSSCFGLVFKLIFRLKLQDPSSPFVAANLNEIKFLSNCEIKLAYGFWWEFQVRIAKNKIKVIEVPVEHRNRIEGKTQVYLLHKLPSIVFTHLKGLIGLKREISR